MQPIESILFINCTGKGKQLSGGLMASINSAVNCFNTTNLTDAIEWLANTAYTLPGIIFLEPVVGNKENKRLLKLLLQISSTNNIPVVAFSAFTSLG